MQSAMPKYQLEKLKKQFEEDGFVVLKNYLDVDQLDDLIVNLKSSNLISVDLETTSTNPSIAEIVGLSFSISKNSAWYIPCLLYTSDAADE